MKKKVFTLITVFVLLFLFDVGRTYGAESDPTKELENELSNVGIKMETSDEWIKGLSKEKYNKTNNVIHNSIEQKPQFIHNNGKPMKNDVLEEANDNYLIGVYQTQLEGKTYEKYYFSNKKDNDIEEFTDDVVKNSKLINSNSKSYIKKLSKEKPPKMEGNSKESVSINAIKSEPSGGYWRTYSWNFYNITGKKSGTFVSNLHFDRKTANANINGKAGSVWDIRAFNEWETSSYRIDMQYTRMDVNYSAQKIHSYGPYNDAGFDVSVNLAGLVSGNAWNFNVGAVFTNNLSSVANKYGRWSWIHMFSWMQDPFVTQPGMRVSNTSGNFAIKTSHTFHTSTTYRHATGVITTYIPDR